MLTLITFMPCLHRTLVTTNCINMADLMLGLVMLPMVIIVLPMVMVKMLGLVVLDK